MFLQRNLTRAKGSLAMQVRSQHMGINSYLCKRKVDGDYSLSCPRGHQSQNPKHMIMSRPQWLNGRGEIWRQAQDRPLEAMISNPVDIKRITRWIPDHDWIKQFWATKAVEMLPRERNRASNYWSEKRCYWFTRTTL